MKKSDNQNEIAGADLQNLPERATLVASQDNSATFLVERPRPVHSATYTPVPDWSFMQPETAIHRATALEVPSTSAAAPIERLQRLITDEVKVVKQLKPDTLAVVLKPDTQTEILLQVHTRNGQIEAHASCERGDFNALSAQWSQLQQTLAVQGVRLMPLAEAPSTSGSATASGSDSHPGQQQQQRQPAPMFDNESTPAPRGKAGKTNSRNSRNREWWA